MAYNAAREGNSAETRLTKMCFQATGKKVREMPDPVSPPAGPRGPAALQFVCGRAGNLFQPACAQWYRTGTAGPLASATSADGSRVDGSVADRGVVTGYGEGVTLGRVLRDLIRPLG